MRILLFTLLIVFGAAGCGRQTVSFLDVNSTVSEDTRSKTSSTSSEVSAVIDLYANVVADTNGLSLTNQDTKKLKKSFKKKLKQLMRVSNAHKKTNLQEIFANLNDIAYQTAVDVGFEDTTDLLVNVTSVAIIYGSPGEFQVESLISGAIRGSNLDANGIDAFMAKFIDMAPIDIANSVPSALIAATEALGIPSEITLNAIAKARPKRTDKFFEKMLIETANLVTKRELSPDLIPNLQEALANIARSTGQESTTNSSFFRDLLTAVQTIAASTTTSATATTTATATATASTVSLAIDYASATLSLTRGVAMTPEDPATGTFIVPSSTPVTSCTVTPALPAGLSLHANNCTISGTPTANHSLTTHTVTVTNNAGNTTTTIDISVVGPTFSTSLNLSSAGNFNCDGAGSCATNNENITISGGTAAATSTDLKKNTDTEWNAIGATLDNVTASSNSLVLNGTTNAAWTMSTDWTPQWDDIFIYYNFEEAAGNASNIANPGTNDGVLTNGATRAAASAKAGGYGITLDGDNDYIETNYSLSNTEPHDLTLMGWYKMADLGTSKGTLMGSRNGAQVFEVFVDGNDSGKLELFIQNGSTWRRVNSTTANLDDDAWHHYAITYGNGGTLRVYIDGNLEPSTTVTGYNTLSVPELCVGCYNYWGTRQDQWAGSVDEFAIWKNDLTATEISLIYQRQKVAYSGIYTSEVIDRGSSAQPTTMSWNSALPFGKSLSTSTTETTSVYSGIENSSGNSTLSDGLLAYFNFDGDVGSGLPDITGNGNDSSSIGGTLYSGYPGIVGNAWRFGSGQTVHGDITIGGKITVSAWILPDSDFSLGNASVVNEGDDGEWDCHYDNQGDDIRLSFDNGSSWGWSDSNVMAVPRGVWSHIVCLRDNTFAGDDYKLYLNGAQNETSAWRDGDSIADNAGSHSLHIGGWSNGTRRFSGLIDEVAIWNRGLSATEVLELYRRGANRLQAQMRSCPDATCSTDPNWVGPGGSQVGISEWHNNTAITTGEPSGNVKNTAPFFLWSDFVSQPSANRYWQYRIFMESLDEGNACTGSTRCNPALVDFSLHDRVGDVVGGSEVVSYNSGYFVNATAVTYSTLTSIVIADSGTCTYQFSPDNGSTFYYHNGSAWTTVSSDANAIANDHAPLSSISGLPAGTQLVIKAFTGSACSITGIQVNGRN